MLTAVNVLPEPISILMLAPASPFPVNHVKPSCSTFEILLSVAMAFTLTVGAVVSNATLKALLSATSACVTLAALPAISVIFTPEALTLIASAGMLMPPASFASSAAIVYVNVRASVPAPPA